MSVLKGFSRPYSWKSAISESSMLWKHYTTEAPTTYIQIFLFISFI
jgi:hypothetical protein